MTVGSSGTRTGTVREWKTTIPKTREQEGNEKKSFPNFGNGKGMKKSIPKIREREGNKKSIPTIRERESEANIPGNTRERERE